MTLRTKIHADKIPCRTHARCTNCKYVDIQMMVKCSMYVHDPNFSWQFGGKTTIKYEPVGCSFVDGDIMKHRPNFSRELGGKM